MLMMTMNAGTRKSRSSPGARLQARHMAGLLALLSLQLLTSCSPMGQSGAQGPGAGMSAPEKATEPPSTPWITATQTGTAVQLATLPWVCPQTDGQFAATEYTSVVSGTTLPVNLFLPPCYDQPDAAFPVLYLLHGYPLDENHWSDLGVEQVLEQMVRQGETTPTILVMPGIPDALNVHSDGGPGSYEQEFLEGLLPFIEANYPADSAASQRALAGISRGGVWALEISLRNPELFVQAAALSPALHVNRPRQSYDPFFILREAQAFPEQIFLSAGEDEPAFRIPTQTLAQDLQARGANVQLLIVEGNHTDENWRRVLPSFLAFIETGWSEASNE